MLELDAASLGGLVVESLLYGTYLVMFVGCIHVLVFRRPRQADGSKVTINKTMLVTSLAIFSMLTAHLILNIARAFDAFIYFRDRNGGPLSFYLNLSEIKNVLKTGLFIATISTADVIMTWRLWTVWGHNRLVVIPPVCTVLGLLVAGGAITYQFSQLKPGETPFQGSSAGWINTCFATTLATNIYGTVLIVYRIWRQNQAMRVVGNSNLTPIVVIIVESAATYSIGMAVTFISFLAKSNVQYPELDATNPLVGIVFSLIIVRVGLGIGLGAQNAAAPFRPSLSGSTRTGPNQYPLTPVRVDITRIVRGDGDSGRETDMTKSEAGVGLDRDIRMA